MNLLTVSPKLPDGAHMIDMLACVKFLHPVDGEVRHWVVKSEGLTIVEAMGMAKLVSTHMHGELYDLTFEFDEDDDDDE